MHSLSCCQSHQRPPGSHTTVWFPSSIWSASWSLKFWWIVWHQGLPRWFIAVKAPLSRGDQSMIASGSFKPQPESFLSAWSHRSYTRPTPWRRLIQLHGPFSWRYWAIWVSAIYGWIGWQSSFVLLAPRCCLMGCHGRESAMAEDTGRETLCLPCFSYSWWTCWMWCFTRRRSGRCSSSLVFEEFPTECRYTPMMSFVSSPPRQLTWRWRASSSASLKVPRASGVIWASARLCPFHVNPCTWSLQLPTSPVWWLNSRCATLGSPCRWPPCLRLPGNIWLMIWSISSQHGRVAWCTRVAVWHW
jgi:hypothetical protein